MPLLISGVHYCPGENLTVGLRCQRRIASVQPAGVSGCPRVFGWHLLQRRKTDGAIFQKLHTSRFEGILDCEKVGLGGGWRSINGFSADDRHAG